MALVPQYINFMHTDLLRQIVNKFGDEQSKTLLKQKITFLIKKPLKWMHDPIPDKEIEAGTGRKRIKVTMEDTRMLKGPKESSVETQELMRV